MDLRGPGPQITKGKETDEIFRLVVEATPNAVVLANAEGGILLVNAGAEKLFGYSREELIGQPVEMLLPQRFRASHPGYRVAYGRQTEARAMGKGRDLFALRKDGSEVPVEIGLNPIETPQGPLVLSAIIDITERKRNEESLRDTQARLNSTLSAGSIGTWTWDLAHDRLFADEFTARMFSLEPAAAAEGLPAEVYLRGVHEEDRPGVAAALNRAIESCGRYDIEYRVCRQDGECCWLQARGRVEGDEAGKALDFHGAVMDITERKEAQENLRRLNEELEQRVIQRTAELEIANKELEAFSYSVSHDLRAPLRAVDGFSQAVLEDYGDQLPEEGRHYLTTIRGGAQRMGALIDDLLTFSRLSRLPLNKRSVAPKRVVREALEELGFPIEGRAVEMRIGDLPSCQGDPALLKQVWLNLLSNALKYTRQREPAVIEVGCTRDDGEQANVYFVRDNGAGFDMRYADKLFGVFQRLHRAEDFEGTGVGLAIVQRIVHRHGGRVWADAAVDRGATFHFTLEGDPTS